MAVRTKIGAMKNVRIGKKTVKRFNVKPQEGKAGRHASKGKSQSS